MGTGYDNIKAATRRVQRPQEWANDKEKGFYVEYLTELSSASVAYFIVSVPTVGVSKIPHGKFQIESEAALSIELYEDCTVSTSTAIGSINIDRNSANTASTTFGYASTVTLGTKIWTAEAGGAYAIGSEEDSTDFKLKQGSTYVLQVTSKAAGNTIVMSYTFHEHDE